MKNLNLSKKKERSMKKIYPYPVSASGHIVISMGRLE